MRTSAKSTMLSGLLSKRLVFVSGKGGVGKSSLTATLGWISARQNKRTLLVELDTIGAIPRIFGRSEVPGYQETGLVPGISCLHVDGKSGLEEYLQMVTKSSRLLQKVFQSPIYQYFVNIAPGLKELMAVGKLWHLEQRTDPVTGVPAYDLILVDTPATGHTISYLQMPMTAAATVKRGLVKREAQKVVDLLRDPERSAFCIASTLAEMPVSEAIELYRTVADQLQLPVACVFVNQVFPDFLDGPDLEAFITWRTAILDGRDASSNTLAVCERAMVAAADSWRRRREAQELQRERLRQGMPCPLIELPFVHQAESSFERIQLLACALDEGRPNHAGKGAPL